MLRGGETLAIGWGVILIPLLWMIYYKYIKRDEGDNARGAYTDGKRSKANGAILAAFLLTIAAAVIYVAFSMKV